MIQRCQLTLHISKEGSLFFEHFFFQFGIHSWLFRPVPGGFYCFKQWQLPGTGRNPRSTADWVMKSPQPIYTLKICHEISSDQWSRDANPTYFRWRLTIFKNILAALMKYLSSTESKHAILACITKPIKMCSQNVHLILK